jgi:hypothetical protein
MRQAVRSAAERRSSAASAASMNGLHFKLSEPRFEPSSAVRARPTPDLHVQRPYLYSRVPYGAVRVEIFTVELRTGRAGERFRRFVYVNVYSGAVRAAPTPYGTRRIRKRIFKVRTGRARPVRRRFIRYFGRRTPYGPYRPRIDAVAVRTGPSRSRFWPSRAVWVCRDRESGRRGREQPTRNAYPLRPLTFSAAALHIARGLCRRARAGSPARCRA